MLRCAGESSSFLVLVREPLAAELPATELPDKELLDEALF
jgi:hypothetical protein